MDILASLYFTERTCIRMPMSTPSGQTTTKYDAVASTEVLDMLQNSAASVEMVNMAVSKLSMDINQEIDKLNMDQNEIRRDVVLLTNRCQANQESIKNISVVLGLFLSSPFVKFLNFFGCWFIYSPYHALPLQNCMMNEIYGKAPLLTRVSRRIRTAFQKLKQRLSPHTYYNHEEPQEVVIQTEEETTNDNEGVQETSVQHTEEPVLERDSAGST